MPFWGGNLMCLAVPARIIRLIGKNAVCDFGGVNRRVNIQLMEEIMPGDYVIVHAGYAIEKLSEEEAQQSIRMWNELLKMEENRHLTQENE